MPQGMTGKEFELSRREFLTTTGGVLAGAAAFGLAGPADAAKRHASRGGTLRFALRSDTTGLDPHRNIQYLVSVPIAAMNQGLLDLDLKAEPAPGVAEAW